jgi:Lipase (class 3)
MRADIDTALSQSDYKGWSVAWGPGLTDDRSNMLYVAQNIVTNQLAVTIRGTDWSFWLDWVEDFASLLPLVPFPFQNAPFNSNVEVAAGTLLGLATLNSLTGVGQIENSPPVTLETFLQEQLNSPDIFVTGHSLGACLATVMAAWLATVFSVSRLKTYTFAAPSAGDAQFASYYNALFTDSTTQKSTAYRLYNSLDSVPNAWASLETIASYYQPAPLCPSYIQDIIADAQSDVGNEYVQVGTAAAGSAISLTGGIIQWPYWLDLDPTGTAPFVWEVDAQHHPATYLSLLDGTTPMLAAASKLLAMGARRRKPVAPA